MTLEIEMLKLPIKRHFSIPSCNPVASYSCVLNVSSIYNLENIPRLNLFFFFLSSV